MALRYENGQYVLDGVKKAGTQSASDRLAIQQKREEAQKNQQTTTKPATQQNTTTATKKQGGFLYDAISRLVGDAEFEVRARVLANQEAEKEFPVLNNTAEKKATEAAIAANQDIITSFDSKWQEINQNGMLSPEQKQAAVSDLYKQVRDAEDAIYNAQTAERESDAAKKAQDQERQSYADAVYNGLVKTRLEDAKDAEDFAEYSAKGAAVNNTSNIVNYMKADMSPENQMYRNWYNLLTDDELATYNYYVGKGDTARADKYMTQVMTPILQAREAQGKADAIADLEGVGKTLATMMVATGAGYESFLTGLVGVAESIGNALGYETDPFQPVQAMTYQKVIENAGGVDKLLGELAYNIGSNAPAMFTGQVSSGLGRAAFGTSVYGNSYREAKEAGVEEAVAHIYSVLNTAAELGLETVLGSIPGVSSTNGVASKIGKSIQKITDGLVKSPTVARLIYSGARMVGGGLGEGVEEYLQSIINPALQNFLLGAENEIQLLSEESMESALVGLLMGVVMNGMAGGNLTTGQRKALSQREAEYLTKQYDDIVQQIGADSPKAAQAYEDMMDALTANAVLDMEATAADVISASQNDGMSTESIVQDNGMRAAILNPENTAELYQYFGKDTTRAMIEAAKAYKIAPATQRTQTTEKAPTVAIETGQQRAAGTATTAAAEQATQTEEAQAANEKAVNATEAANKIIRNAEEKAKVRFRQTMRGDGFGQSSRQSQTALNSASEAIAVLSETGELTSDIVQEIFDDLWDNTEVRADLIRANGEYRDEVLSYLNQRLYADGADMNAREAAKGKIKVSDNNKYIGVSVAYKEMSDAFPNLFPDSITNASDQLERMAEVYDEFKPTKQSAESSAYMEKESASRMFHEAAEAMRKSIDLAQRIAQQRANVLEPMPLEQARDKINLYKKQKEEADRRANLNKAERNAVDAMLSGTKSFADVEFDAQRYDIDPQKVMGVFEASLPYYKAEEALGEQARKYRSELHEEAESIVENSSEWKDHRFGAVLEISTPEQVFKNVAGENDGQRMVDFILSPLREARADRTRYMAEWNKRIEEASEGKLQKRHSVLFKKTNDSKAQKVDVTESVLVQYLGELRTAIKTTEDALGKTNLTEQKRKDLEDSLRLLQEQNKRIVGSLSKDANDRIDKTIAVAQEAYNDIWKRLDEERARQGLPRIGFIEGYFPHFIGKDADLSGSLSEMRFETDLNRGARVAYDLPREIEGETSKFRPNQKWMPNVLQRSLDKTDYDFVKGWRAYSEGMADNIFLSDIVVRTRALEDALRFQWSDSSVKDRVKEINNDSRLTAEEKAIKRNDVYKDAEEEQKRLGAFTSWLRQYGNDLAGKTNDGDRNFQKMFDRGALEVANRLSNRYKRNTVSGSLSSAIMNFVPIVAASGEVDTANMLGAVIDTIKRAKIDYQGKSADIKDVSDFIVDRLGYDQAGATNLEKVTSASMLAMRFVDQVTTEIVVRAKYAQNKQAGMTDAQALDNANTFALQVMASRSKGERAAIFRRKNPLINMATAFSIEPLNQYAYWFKRMPKNISAETNRKAFNTAVSMSKAYAKIAVGSMLFNMITQLMFGRDALPDPIKWGWEFINDLADDDKETNFFTAVSDLVDEVKDEIPIIGGLVFDGGRIPISSALPDLTKIINAASNTEWSDGDRVHAIGEELFKPLVYLIAPTLGGPVRKAAVGIDTVARGGLYNVDSKGEKELKFAVDSDEMTNYLLALIGGRYALPEAQEWTRDGYPVMSAKNTAAFEKLRKEVSKDTALEIVSMINGFEATEDETKTDQIRKYLYNLDLPAETKKYLYGHYIDKETVGKAEKAEEIGVDNDRFMDAYDVIRNRSKKLNRLTGLVDDGFSYKDAFALYDIITGSSALGTDAKRAKSYYTSTKKLSEERFYKLYLTAEEHEGKVGRYGALKRAGMSSDEAKEFLQRVYGYSKDKGYPDEE